MMMEENQCTRFVFANLTVARGAEPAPQRGRFPSLPQGGRSIK